MVLGWESKAISISIWYYRRRRRVRVCLRLGKKVLWDWRCIVRWWWWALRAQKKNEYIYFTIDDYIIIGFHILTRIHILVHRSPLCLRGPFIQKSTWCTAHRNTAQHTHTQCMVPIYLYLLVLQLYKKPSLALRFIIIKMFIVWLLPSSSPVFTISIARESENHDVFSVSILMFCLFLYIYPPRAFGVYYTFLFCLIHSSIRMLIVFFSRVVLIINGIVVAVVVGKQANRKCTLNVFIINWYSWL